MAASDHLAPVQFGDYTLTTEPGLVSATHPDTAAYGSIGHLSWNKTTEGAKISDVFVDRAHRHNGLATAMYQQATRATGRPLSHSAYRTDDGEGWARTVGGAMPPRREAGRE